METTMSILFRRFYTNPKVTGGIPVNIRKYKVADKIGKKSFQR